MLHVDLINADVGNGITEPMYANVAGEGVEQPFPAIIKIRSNPEGVRVLVNELVAYRLSSKLGLPVPESGVAIVDEYTKSECRELAPNDYGSCFYSKRIHPANVLNAELIKRATNKNDFERIILFDHIIYNKDRNKGNLLISGKKGDSCVYAIDHSHVFKNEAIWNASSLYQGIADGDYADTCILDTDFYAPLLEWISITKGSIDAVLIDFRQILTDQLVHEAVFDLPKDWIIPDNDLVALEKYILYRIDHLDEIRDMIVKWLGGRNDDGKSY